MKDKAGARRLQCAICRRGLLKEYNVYDVPEEGAPVLYSAVSGYFYRKNACHLGEKLEIAGHISEGNSHYCRMLVFADTDNALGCKMEDLVDIGGPGSDGSIYRISDIYDLYGICSVLELEVWPYSI